MSPVRSVIPLFLICLLFGSQAWEQEIYAHGNVAYYNVQKGDNLTKIAQKFNVQVADIVEWNRLKSANHIFVGQRLKIYARANSPVSNPSRDRTLSSGDARALHLSRPVPEWSVMVGYRPYGDTRHYGLLCRIRGEPAIFPAHEGKIARIGQMRGYGKYILIDHGSGWHSMYSNLRQIYVKPGQYVSLKDSIGAVENDKLFFLLAYRGKPVNPTGYFR